MSKSLWIDKVQWISLHRLHRSLPHCRCVDQVNARLEYFACFHSAVFQQWPKAIITLDPSIKVVSSAVHRRFPAVRMDKSEGCSLAEKVGWLDEFFDTMHGSVRPQATAEHQYLPAAVG